MKQSARAAKKDFPFALELRKAQLQLERGEEEEEAGKADLRVLFVPHRLQRLDWDSRTLGGPAQAEQEREQQEEERRRAAIDKRRHEQKHGAGLVDEGVAMSAAVTQRMDEELRAPHDSAPPTRRTSLQRLRSASRKASARALAVAELSKAGKERSSAQAATDRAMVLLRRGGSNRRLSQRASDPDADNDRSALLLNTADGPRAKRPSTGSVVEMMQADRDRRKTLPPVQQRGDARRAPRPASARVRRQYIAERDAARAARASLVPPPDKQRELDRIADAAEREKQAQWLEEQVRAGRMTSSSPLLRPSSHARSRKVSVRTTKSPKHRRSSSKQGAQGSASTLVSPIANSVHLNASTTSGLGGAMRLSVLQQLHDSDDESSDDDIVVEDDLSDPAGSSDDEREAGCVCMLPCPARCFASQACSLAPTALCRRRHVRWLWQLPSRLVNASHWRRSTHRL